MDDGIQTYERLLLRRAREFGDGSNLEQLNDEQLVELTRERGIDFATAVLYDRLLHSRRCLTNAMHIAGNPNPVATAPSAWAIVPGAFYREKKNTGADGESLKAEAARRGIRCEVVPLASFGEVEHNADALAEWLAKRHDESWTLISLSKGSLEVRRLLERRDASTLLAPVTAWISLSGLVAGSPLVSWLLRRPLRVLGVRSLLWWQGYDFNVVRQLDRTPELARPMPLLPRHLAAVHVVGFPLRHNLSSPLMRRGHRRLSVHGPNDGAGVILADTVNWTGLIYPVWGADHYLRANNDDLSTIVARVLHMLSTKESTFSEHSTPSASLELIR